MQERHQHRQVPMRRDQRIVHVAGVRCGVAKPQQAGQFPSSRQQASEPPGAAIGRRAVPGIDVSGEQRISRAPCPTSRRASAITAAAGGWSRHRVCRHDTEAAEPVAAPPGIVQKGGDSLRRRRVRQEVELVLGRKIGLDHRAAGPGARAIISASR